VSHYTLDELLILWRREELTAEQLLGQLLQVLRAQERRLRELERQIPATDAGKAVGSG
jgi:flagellar biosynthesis chaperone FliJ